MIMVVMIVDKERRESFITDMHKQELKDKTAMEYNTSEVRRRSMNQLYALYIGSTHHKLSFCELCILDFTYGTTAKAR